jgi:hypothetical protein
MKTLLFSKIPENQPYFKGFMHNPEDINRLTKSPEFGFTCHQNEIIKLELSQSEEAKISPNDLLIFNLSKKL